MQHLSIPRPPVSYFMIGPITIHYYALCILGGIIIAALITAKRIARVGIPRGVVLDVSVWAVVVGIIGGRLYHVVTHPTDYFYKGADLWTIFAVWDGGLAIFGSILFGTLGVFIGCRRAGIRFFAFADALAPAFSTRRRSVGWATTSTRNSTGRPPPCRGGCRSSHPARRIHQDCHQAPCSNRYFFTK